MSGSVVSASINNFPNPSATAPEKRRHLGRAFGLLSSIQPAEECQLAQIGDRLMVLPDDIDLSQYLGQRIGMMRYEDRILVRRLV
jgi:hypothetical protein